MKELIGTVMGIFFQILILSYFLASLMGFMLGVTREGCRMEETRINMLVPTYRLGCYLSAPVGSKYYYGNQNE